MCWPPYPVHTHTHRNYQMKTTTTQIKSNIYSDACVKERKRQNAILKRKLISAIAISHYFLSESAIKIPEGHSYVTLHRKFAPLSWDLFVNLRTQGQVSNKSSFCITSKYRPTTERRIKYRMSICLTILYLNHFTETRATTTNHFHHQ